VRASSASSRRETVRLDVDPLAAAARLAEAKRDPARALSIGRDERALLDRVRFLADDAELSMLTSSGPSLAHRRACRKRLRRAASSGYKSARFAPG
jgi:hypothetical protein